MSFKQASVVGIAKLLPVAGSLGLACAQPLSVQIQRGKDDCVCAGTTTRSRDEFLVLQPVNCVLKLAVLPLEQPGPIRNTWIITGAALSLAASYSQVSLTLVCLCVMPRVCLHKELCIMTAHRLVGWCSKARPGGGGESWLASTHNAYWSRP